jgi:phosphatidate cytidylyltransferase
VSERKNKGGRSPERQPAEGVRIIRAEEAQAALDAGEAAGRRPDDQLRFGDVPPVPSGPRPAHRFPLPDSVNPADAVPIRPVAASRPAPSPEPEKGWGTPPAEWGLGERTAEIEQVHHQDPGASAPRYLPDEGITVTGGTTDLPHWTDPPTGEVPRILADDQYRDAPGDDDLEAWRALGSKGVRWRDSEDDWDESDEIADLVGDVEPIGVLDQTRADHSDLYSFDEEFERVTSRTGSQPVVVAGPEDEFDAEPDEEWQAPAEPVRRATRAGNARVDSRPRTAPKSGGPGRPTRPGGSGGGGGGGGGADDLGSRVAVGVGLVVVLAIAYAAGSKVLVVFVALVAVAAAAEGFGMLQRAGFRPATLLGLVATLGTVLATYWRGVEVLPIALVVVFAATMMWYVLGIVEARPLANVAVTVMIFVWVGVLGSFASVLLREGKGRNLFLGAVLVAIAADIAAFLIGRAVGSRPIAESVSPNKTVEGFFGGLVGALIVGALVGKELAPWGGLKHGLVLGLVIGIVGPMGDLFESMMKRDLGVKDSGTILPGHGGLLDRFDSILLALPSAYFVYAAYHLSTVAKR